MSLRRDLPPLPSRMKALPVDKRGYPVPWFVAWINGEPDFRVVKPRAIEIAHTQERCWLCGGGRGPGGAFVIGPMCAINRVSSEPPSHFSCAKFAAMACPFLTRPMAKRNERDMPQGAVDPAGCMIKRNPGVSLVWVTPSYEAFDAGNGHLFRIGQPERAMWFCEGRAATRAEVLASIDSGYPLLKEAAESDGPEAVEELQAMLAEASALLPVAA